MKKVLTYSLSGFLAFAVLFASTGVVIVSHACAESRKSDVSLYQKDGCCSDPAKSCESKSKSREHLSKDCCQLSVNFLKIDITSLLHTFHASLALFAAPPAESKVLHNPVYGSANPQLPRPDLPDSGRDFLHSIHLLLI